MCCLYSLGYIIIVTGNVTELSSINKYSILLYIQASDVNKGGYAGNSSNSILYSVIDHDYGCKIT